jgi:hypothetical protein
MSRGLMHHIRKFHYEDENSCGGGSGDGGDDDKASSLLLVQEKSHWVKVPQVILLRSACEGRGS